MDAGWRPIPVHDSDPIGLPTSNPEDGDGGEQGSTIDGRSIGLEATAEIEHARFISNLSDNSALVEVRDAHISMLGQTAGMVEATREWIASIPTMEVMAAHLEGVSSDGTLRIPLSGVSKDGISINVGIISGETVMRLAIDGVGSRFERVARIGGGRPIILHGVSDI